MKKAAFIIGLIGGIIGVFNLVIFVGAIENIDIAAVVALLGISFVLAIAALVGACIVRTYETAGGSLMLVYGVYSFAMGLMLLVLKGQTDDNLKGFGLILLLLMIPMIVAGVLGIVSRKPQAKAKHLNGYFSPSNNQAERM